MADFESNKATAASWMYERKDRPVEWWRWTVLTAHNPDPESLKLDPKTAFLVFADFVQRGMLVPVVASNGHEAYSINPGRDAEWQQVMHPTYHAIKAGSWKLGEWLIGGLIGALLGAGVTAFFAC